MAHSVCPVWIGYLLLSPFRKLRQNPQKILSKYVEPGMQVVDYGSAMGYFSIPLAQMIGAEGKVFCLDVQQKMLTVLLKRAAKRKLEKRIKNIFLPENQNFFKENESQLDFILLFAVVHEVPDVNELFSNLKLLLKADGKILFAEPAGHVSKSAFNESLKVAEQNGFSVQEELRINSSHSVVLVKSE